MRKNSLTLAVLTLFSTGALAQSSNVTLSGRVDMGIQHIDNGVTTVKNVDSGTYTASRMVLRGTEDLGNGLSALFAMEHRFNADTGAVQSAAKFWNAGAYVGLSSKDWGTLTLGRQYVPIFWSFLFADDTGPLRLHTYSAVQSVQRSSFARISASASPIKSAGSLDALSGGVYSIGITSAFEDNNIVYKTPNFHGVTAMVSTNATEGAATGGKSRSANVEYRQGPLYASVAATTKEGRISNASGTQNQKISEQLISAMYEVAPGMKLWGNLHPWQFKSLDNTELTGKDWMLGASYRFANNQVWINYASKKLNNCNACDSSGWGIGYHYSLSKRTELYASIAQVSNGANAATTLNGNAPGAFGLKVRATAVGVATTF